ncbi:hypothetical protein D3C72_485860 [compost metagenome]
MSYPQIGNRASLGLARARAEGCLLMVLVAAVGSEDGLVVSKLAEVREVRIPSLRCASAGAFFIY